MPWTARQTCNRKVKSRAAARNMMFEIPIAGRLARAGLRPILGQEPDVDTEFQTAKYSSSLSWSSRDGISKRPVESRKATQTNLIALAIRRDCGIIAISISRAFNKGDKLLVAHDEDRYGESSNDGIAAINQVAVEDYRHVTKPKIAGVCITFRHLHFSRP